MFELAVIGGGFWGTAVAYEARSRGVETVLIDDAGPAGASRAAAGIICLDWYKQDTVKRMLPAHWGPEAARYGLEWLGAAGGRLSRTGELFSGYHRPDTRYRPDCYLLASPGDLLETVPKRVGTVSGLVREVASPSAWRITLADGDTIPARRVVVAAGAATDRILALARLLPVEVRPLFGRAIIGRTALDCTTPRTHMTRPYQHYTLRQWGHPGFGRVRLGDTVERLPNSSQVAAMLTSVAPVFGAIKVEEELSGARPVCEKMVVRRVAPGCLAATGGHRVGLALAGWVAREAFRLLFEDAGEPSADA